MTWGYFKGLTRKRIVLISKWLLLDLNCKGLVRVRTLTSIKNMTSIALLGLILATYGLL